MCSVLFCSVLFCSVLFCSVLFCSVLFCSVLFCSVLFCSVLFCSVLFGSARLGSARLGSARLGSARLGSVRFGSVRFSVRRYLSFCVSGFTQPQPQPQRLDSVSLSGLSLDDPSWLSVRLSSFAYSCVVVANAASSINDEFIAVDGQRTFKRSHLIFGHCRHDKHVDNHS